MCHCRLHRNTLALSCIACKHAACTILALYAATIPLPAQQHPTAATFTPLFYTILHQTLIQYFCSAALTTISRLSLLT